MRPPSELMDTIFNGPIGSGKVSLPGAYKQSIDGSSSTAVSSYRGHSPTH